MALQHSVLIALLVIAMACGSSDPASTSMSPTDTRDAATADALDAMPGPDAGRDATPSSSQGGDWSCGGEVGPVVQVETVRLAGNLGVLAADPPVPAEGILVKACDFPFCNSPVASDLTDESGRFELDLPMSPPSTGFRSYLELEGFQVPDQAVLFSNPIAEDITDLHLDVITQDTWDQFVVDAGVTIDPALSQGVITARDCSRSPVAGLAFSPTKAIDTEQVFYLTQDGASVDAEGTDARGIGGVFNFRPLAFELNVTDGGLLVEETQLLGRSGWITQLLVRPDVQVPDIVSDWWCLAYPLGPPVAQSLTVSGNVAQALSGGHALNGPVTVRACRANDPACESPLDTTQSGQYGIFSLTLYIGPDSGGFDGYFEVTGDTIVSTLYYLGNPLMDDETGLSMEVLTTSRWAELAAEAGVELDPARGHVGVATQTCGRVPAAGVSLRLDTADDASTEVYLAEGELSATATATDPGGIAGFFNVPVGPMMMTVVTDEELVVAERGLLARAGWLTELVAWPRRPLPSP